MSKTSVLTTPALRTLAEATEPAGQDQLTITLAVNGERRQLRIDPRVTLLDAVRERLNLTGTKEVTTVEGHRRRRATASGAAGLHRAEAAITELLRLANTHERSPFRGLDPSYGKGDVKAGGLSMSFGTLLTRCDVPAVEATATSPRNENSTVAYRSFGAHFCEVRVHRLTAEPGSPAGCR